MAKNEIVWGIDVGNTSLKALRCRVGSEPGKLEVLGFDFIEHSKVLSQPGADATEILAETLALFLSRNNIKGEKVAIAVSGQSALWRFQPLPPVDPRKIKDLVKYEVRQWLPFDLDDVIWHYRQVGGFQEGNILLDTNIFMYAIKKELTYKTLATYSKNGIDVDCIQGAPISLFNSYVNDFYDPEEFEGKDPSELTEFDILLNVGTDTTEVVITNGIIVWLRNIPIGGNLFTKSLTKTLKLTFSNAEHIKRNAASSQDPKAVILAMKPVFNEMLSEIDRSIKYYCSLNKKAKIRKIYALGNAMKLPGLRQFLAKSHGIDVVVPTSFNKLTGQEVLSNPQFTENLSSFGVAYGLALELLHQASLDINLMPKEVLRKRLINSKKPWALCAAALLILALTIQYVSSTVAYSVVENQEFTTAYNSAKQVNDLSKKLAGNVRKEVDSFKAMDKIGKNLTSNVEGRLTWLELIKTLNTLFPAESLPPEVFNMPVREKSAAIMNQNRVYVQNIEVLNCTDLAGWFESVRQWYSIDDEEATWFEEGSGVDLQSAYFPKDGYKPIVVKKKEDKAADGSANGSAAKPAVSGADTSASPTSLTSGFVAGVDPRIATIPPPTGSGKIVQLTCYHYHNPEDINEPNRGPEYVRRVFLPRIKYGSIELPNSLERQRKEGLKMETWALKEFGIFYPVMIDPGPIDDNFRLLDPEAAAAEYRKIRESTLKGRSSGTSSSMKSGGSSVPGLDTIADNLTRSGDDKVLNLRRYDFVVQFVWIETPPSVRESRRGKVEETQEGAEDASENPPTNDAAVKTNAAAPPSASPAEGPAEQAPDEASEPPTEGPAEQAPDEASEPSTEGPAEQAPDEASEPPTEGPAEQAPDEASEPPTEGPAAPPAEGPAE